MGFIDEFKRGYVGKEPHYEIAGEQIVCPHCGGQSFELGEAQLNTAGMTFFNLDWLNRNATLLICSDCSNIQWFLDKPELQS